MHTASTYLGYLFGLQYSAAGRGWQWADGSKPGWTQWALQQPYLSAAHLLLQGMTPSCAYANAQSQWIMEHCWSSRGLRGGPQGFAIACSVDADTDDPPSPLAKLDLESDSHFSEADVLEGASKEQASHYWAAGCTEAGTAQPFFGAEVECASKYGGHLLSSTSASHLWQASTHLGGSCAPHAAGGVRGLPTWVGLTSATVAAAASNTEYRWLQDGSLPSTDAGGVWARREPKAQAARASWDNSCAAYLPPGTPGAAAEGGAAVRNCSEPMAFVCEVTGAMVQRLLRRTELNATLECTRNAHCAAKPGSTCDTSAYVCVAPPPPPPVPRTIDLAFTVRSSYAELSADPLKLQQFRNELLGVVSYVAGGGLTREMCRILAVGAGATDSFTAVRLLVVVPKALDPAPMIANLQALQPSLDQLRGSPYERWAKWSVITCLMMKATIDGGAAPTTVFCVQPAVASPQQRSVRVKPPMAFWVLLAVLLVAAVVVVALAAVVCFRLRSSMQDSVLFDDDAETIRRQALKQGPGSPMVVVALEHNLAYRVTRASADSCNAAGQMRTFGSFLGLAGRMGTATNNAAFVPGLPTPGTSVSITTTGLAPPIRCESP